MLTKNGLIKHIKKCKIRGSSFNFLGLVEHQDITPDVEHLFIFHSPSGAAGYDWVHGNEKLKQLILTV